MSRLPFLPVVGVGATVRCNVDDTSWYCQLAKFFSTVFMISILLVVAYYAYTLLRGWYNTKKRK